MSDAICGCGCGKKAGKSGFAWGHTPKKGAAAPGAEEEDAGGGVVSLENDGCEVWMTRRQMDAIWAGLPVRVAAVALLTALEAQPKAGGE